MCARRAEGGGGEDDGGRRVRSEACFTPLVCLAPPFILPLPAPWCSQGLKPGARLAGTFKAEKFYLRADVAELHTAEQWRRPEVDERGRLVREGREVRPGEGALAPIPARFPLRGPSLDRGLRPSIARPSRPRPSLS